MASKIPPDLFTILQRPGNLVFPSNRSYLRDVPGRCVDAVRQPSGHVICYDPHGRRILATDSEGNPLHECEWGTDQHERVVLSRARFQLEWGQWVGLKPGGMVRSTGLDLSTRPGWERLRADDLRQMAAQAMGVTLDEVRFFYPDHDLTIDAGGQATIRHRKDVFYKLQDGTFGNPQFMACMGAMHWDDIDFLPVVELFQSLLPGTGSATFELIRGLYDDQNRQQPRPLHYRGIPTYPSEAAFRLFSAFFSAQLEGGGDPFPVFMDAPRSHEVTWLPDPNPPRRYFDPERKLCVTIKGEKVQKVTQSDDPSGLPFSSPSPSGFAPCDRRVHVVRGVLELHDGGKVATVPAKPSWGRLQDTQQQQLVTCPLAWRSLLGDDFPAVDPPAAFSAVLSYPEGAAEVAEWSSQPFAGDHLQDVLEQDPRLGAHLAHATRVLIDNFDGASGSCICLDRPRDYTVLYRSPEFAQKCAQNVWNQLAQSSRLEWAKAFRFHPAEAFRDKAYSERYDLIYLWVPFAQFNELEQLHALADRVTSALDSRGLACVVGPSAMALMLQGAPLQVIYSSPVQDLPSFRMHLTILPQSRLRPGLTLFFLTKT